MFAARRRARLFPGRRGGVQRSVALSDAERLQIRRRRLLLDSARACACALCAPAPGGAHGWRPTRRWPVRCLSRRPPCVPVQERRPVPAGEAWSMLGPVDLPVSVTLPVCWPHRGAVPPSASPAGSDAADHGRRLRDVVGAGTRPVPHRSVGSCAGQPRGLGATVAVGNAGGGQRVEFLRLRGTARPEGAILCLRASRRQPLLVCP